MFSDQRPQQGLIQSQRRSEADIADHTEPQPTSSHRRTQARPVCLPEQTYTWPQRNSVSNQRSYRPASAHNIHRANAFYSQQTD